MIEDFSTLCAQTLFISLKNNSIIIKEITINLKQLEMKTINLKKNNGRNNKMKSKKMKPSLLNLELMLQDHLWPNVESKNLKKWK
jgi:hypothetical protein